MADSEKKPLAVIALGLGKKPEEGGDDEASEYDSDFESAAVDAFPELEDQPDRVKAFEQAVMACVDRALAKQKGKKDDA